MGGVCVDSAEAVMMPYNHRELEAGLYGIIQSPVQTLAQDKYHAICSDVFNGRWRQPVYG